MISRNNLLLSCALIAFFFLQGKELFCINSKDSQEQQNVFVNELINKSGDRFRWSHHARLEFAQTAFESARSLGDESLRMKAMYCLAELYFHEGRFEPAMLYLDSLIAYSKETHDLELQIKSETHKGAIHRYRGELYQSLGITYDASLRTRNGNMAHLHALVMNNLGVIYRNLGDDELAKKHYEEALESARILKDTAQIIQSFINLGNLYWFQKDAEQAIQYYNEGMVLALQSKDLQHISSLTNNIGNTLREKGNYDEALEYYFKALAQQEEVCLVGLKMIILRNIGITYQRKGDFDNAQKYVHESLSLAEQLGLIHFYRDNYLLLSDLSYAKGNTEEAYQFLSEYNKLNQQVFQDQLLNSVSYFNERVFDAQQKEDLYRVRLERNLLILIIVVLLLVSVISFTALNYYRFKEKRIHIGHLKNTIVEKEATERALRRSEENYQTLIKTLNEGLVVLDMNNQIEFLNLKACKVLGVDDKKELLGKRFDSFLLTAEDEKLFQDKMELQKMGISDHYEVKMKNIAGDVLWVNLSSAPILDEQLKAKGSVTLITDVSDRKKSEETYSELTSSLNQKIKQLNCLYDISDISGVPGITFEDIIEKSLEIIPVGLKYSHDIGVEVMFDNKTYCSANYRETPWTYVVPIKVQKKKLGHIKVVYLEEKPLINKDPFHFNEKILLKNISEKFGQIVESKNIDRILRENKERLEEIQRLARIGNWEKDHENQEIIFSDTFFEIAGITPERRKFFDLDKMGEMIHPDDRDAFAELTHEKILNSKAEDLSVNFRMITQNGNIRGIFSSRKLILDDQGNILRSVYTLQDITEQKINQELQYHAEVALKTSEAKQQVLANMSFEMRTPVNGIMGILDFLQKTKLTAEQKNLVATIKDSGQGLIAIINNISELAQIEHGKLHVNLQKVEFDAFLNRVQDLFAILTRHKDLRLKVKTDKKLPRVIITDQERLFQLISGLLSSAVNRNDRGDISMHISVESVFKDQLAVLVEITDPIGSAAFSKKKSSAKKPAISQKPDEAIDSEHALSMSQKLAELLGGNLICEETEGAGTKVYFSFLAKMTNEQAKKTPVIKPEVSEIQKDIAGLKVLCVEDRVINQKVLTLMLSHAGCEVTLANNGVEAIKLLRSTTFDVVLLDMVMPVMDGIETLEVLEKEFNDIPPVIAVTAKTLDSDKELYFSKGASDFISKPVNAAELYEKLAYWHGRKTKEIIMNSEKA